VRKTEKQALKGLDKKEQKTLAKLLARIEANLSANAAGSRSTTRTTSTSDSGMANLTPLLPRPASACAEERATAASEPAALVVQCRLKQPPTATPAAAILLVFGDRHAVRLPRHQREISRAVRHGRRRSSRGCGSRCIVVLVLLLFRGWRNPAMFRVKACRKQVLRGVFLFGSTIFNFLALKTLQLAETMSIFFFAPMVITALAGPLLGEWAGWRRWLAVCGRLRRRAGDHAAGLRHAFDLGHVYALCATLSYCFYVIMTRRMSATETREPDLLFGAGARRADGCRPFPSPPRCRRRLRTGSSCCSLGFFGGFGHWLLIKAYRQASATALAPYPYLQMVWMIGFGWLVFAQLPDRLDARRRRDHRRQRALHRASRTSAAAAPAGPSPNTEDSELAKKL
jgi:drug/metabolite transporter (DMT)-like permease